MPTPAERKALLFFGVVTFLGGAARFVQAHADARSRPAGAQRALAAHISSVDSALAARSGKAGKRGSRRGAARPDTIPSIIDLDTANASQIETLRGIGPMMAERIVADRDSFGAFGSLEGLQRVRGIGPGLAERVSANVTFSGVPRPVNTVIARRSKRPTVRRKPRQRD